VTVKAEQEQNIFDLTAHESVSLGVPQAEQLIKAFEAIARDELSARFSEQPPPTVLVTEAGVKWWRRLIKHAIFALEQNPHFFVPWFRFVFVNLGDYVRWRHTTSDVPPAPRPKRMSLRQVQSGMKIYLEQEGAAGRQGSQKRAWTWAQANMPTAKHPQVMKALALEEGGKKARGRPRKTSQDRKST
jgi:hypothetical protein